MQVGRIAGLFGVRGELKCDPTSSGRNLFRPGARLRSECGERTEPVRLASVRDHKGRLLVTFEEAGDAEEARRFVGAALFAPRDAIELEEGEYFDDDLVGCVVRGQDGTTYGTVEGVEHYPASDMLIVSGNMLPMVKAFIRSIDIPSRSIVVSDIPAGLLDRECSDF